MDNLLLQPLVFYLQQQSSLSLKILKLTMGPQQTNQG